MSLSFELTLFFITLLFAGLFAFLETAFTALRLFKLKEMAISITRYKSLFESWEKNPQRILITILIANNFAHVLASVLISNIMQKFLGTFGLAVGVALATIMILVFGEIIPKSLAKSHHEKLFESSLWLINILFHLEYPMVTILLQLAEFFFERLGRGHILQKEEAVSEKEIEFLIDYSDQKGLMETEKTEMLQNIFSLGQTLVKEVIVPRNEVVSLSVTAGLDEAKKIFNESRFSRIPIYEGTEENIIGFLHQKDIFGLLDRGEKRPLKTLIRPIMFVPETQKINQLLSEFLKKKMHIAIVINEYGNIVGLVTLEDVLEEIVGEIADEHEQTHPDVIPLEDGGWLVDGRVELEELEDLLHISFATKNSVTLAGFLTEKLQHLPKKGERLFYENYCFQVQQASSRRVYQVLVFESSDEKNLLDKQERDEP